MVAAEPKIFFFFNDVRLTLKNRTSLKSFIKGIFKNENKDLAQLNCIFCTDEFLLQINDQYLKHNYYTDIITFDLSDSTLIRGELYISADRIKENASFLKITRKEELHRVIFHGVLHLCGYNDKSKEEIKIIRKKEDQYLNEYLKFRY